jgi:Uma2 family endonuclease
LRMYRAAKEESGMPTEFPLLESYTDERIAELSRLNPHMRLARGLAGELLASPGLDDARARHAAMLCMQLAVWYGDYRAGELFDSSTGFRFGEGALLFADAAWVERDRWKWLSEGERRAFPPVCPSVAFEMVLPGDSLPLARERGRMFLEGGAKAVAFIDIERRSTEVHRPGGVTPYRSDREVRVIELGYFTMDMTKIFA